MDILSKDLLRVLIISDGESRLRVVLNRQENIRSSLLDGVDTGCRPELDSKVDGDFAVAELENRASKAFKCNSALERERERERKSKGEDKQEVRVCNHPSSVLCSQKPPPPAFAHTRFIMTHILQFDCVTSRKP